MHRCSFIAALAFAALIHAPAHAASAAKPSDANLAGIEAFLSQPEAKIDVAKAILEIDKMVDPSVDPAASLREIDKMASDIQSRLPPGARSGDKLDALRAQIYQAGPWNQYKPFSYDLDDPFGKVIENKLLSHYLASRKGNCVSMPLLFVALGQRIGLDVTAASAPEHVFVKFRDEKGVYYNIEATSGANFARDSWMRQQSPEITDKSIASGAYMRPLSRRETVALAADVLAEQYAQRKQEERRIALSKAELAAYPNYIPAMLHISSANYRMRKAEFVDKYPRPSDIPPELRERFAQLDSEMARWQGKARDAGWIRPDEADRIRYEKVVGKAKAELAKQQ